ncbi:MAG: protein translocase subunit SecD, partial [Gammaproteobacteria bacterium]
MNQYPLWRYVLVLVVLVIGTLYALPNLYGQDPALQISPRRSASIDEAVEKRVVDALGVAKITLKRSERSLNRILLRFPDDSTRAAAIPVVNTTLDAKQYLAALNLAPATPAWLRAIGGQPMYMGLDLRGGVHFLMQVDTEAVDKQIEERFISELRTGFREEKIRFRTVTRAANGGLEVRFLNAQALAGGRDYLNRDYVDLDVTDGGTADEFTVHLAPRPTFVSETRKTAIKQNLTTLRNRINEFGVAEPVIQQQGDSRIVVQ